MITIGIPVLNYYEGLRLLLQDINNSTYKDIEKVIVINNGKKEIGAQSYWFDLVVFEPTNNLGVAGSWNKIINLSSGIRFILNDDLRIEPKTLENLVNLLDKESVCYPICNKPLSSFSFFTITDEVINKIGLFDESISPNYAYFEDNDYHRRMYLAGVNLKALPVVENGMVFHEGSKTLKNFSDAEKQIHHKKFNLAKDNFVKKWGGEPGREKYLTPYNK